MRTAPVLPESVRRRIPKGSTYGLVPLWTADQKGDEIQGLIRVPDGLTHSLPMTEKKRQFDQCVKDGIKRWADWRGANGWVLNSKPKVQGPFDPPSKDSKTKALDEGMKWYFVTAFFKREYPLYTPQDAAHWLQQEAERYGFGNRPIAASVDSQEHKGVKTILNPERVDPMKFAAERRERLGITKDDWTQQPIGPADGDSLQVV